MRRDQAGVDRVGLGWRGEIVAGIFEHLDCIDVLEVVAEDRAFASRHGTAALAELARLRPLSLHGVTLGLASSTPVAAWRLERMARQVERVQPESWSEHLAFVRAGGIEIGHLAAPPRTAATVDGTQANLARAARIVGALPMMENVATLIAPPASTMHEAAWVSEIIRGSGAHLLLDLHNLQANAVNFGQSPLALLQAMPLERVSSVHLAGGRYVTPPGGGARRLLDDHLHDVPDEVFALLEALACQVPQRLTVILERDGEYPDFGVLLLQLDQARQALARGRAARLALAAPERQAA